MEEETFRTVPLVPSQRLRTLGSEIIPLEQLKAWFENGSSFQDTFLEFVKRGYKIGLSGTTEDISSQFIDVVALANRYVDQEMIDPDLVRINASPRLFRRLQMGLHIPANQPVEVPTSLSARRAMVMGYPVTSNDERSYIFLPFHPLIELEIFNES